MGYSDRAPIPPRVIFYPVLPLNVNLHDLDNVDHSGLSMGHIHLSHSHPIAIYACPIPWDVSHGIPIGIPTPWTSLRTLLRNTGLNIRFTFSENAALTIMNGSLD